MTVVSFIHLFIYFVSKSSPPLTDERKEYSLGRLTKWIETKKGSNCGNFIFDFLKFLSDRNNRQWIVNTTDPLSNESLIKKELIVELHKNAEIALCILAVHDGDIQKLFQFCTKTRLFRIDKRFMNPAKISDGQKNSCFKEIKAKCNPKKNLDLMLELIERNGFFYLEASGERRHFSTVESGLNKIHARMFSIRMSGFRKIYSNHVVKSTLILAEFSRGPSTEVSFESFQGESFNVQHTGLLLFDLKFRNSDKNLSWRLTEYQRYHKRFMEQLEMYRTKQREYKNSNCRFFGELSCTIRCGRCYYFNIPETLSNTFETVTLAQVEANVSKHDEMFKLQNVASVIEELKNYNSYTLVKSKQEHLDQASKAPLLLMPLQDMKKLSMNANIKARQKTAVQVKKSNGVGQSFYPQWIHGIDRVNELARANGFVEVQPNVDDHYSTISVYWRQRELSVNVNMNGLVTDIRYRCTRWFAATTQRFEADSGDDVRAYLECRAPLDDDDSGLETVIDYLNGRAVFTENFLNQLQQIDMGTDLQEPLTSQPLIPEIFHLNWKFRSMRRLKTVAKFVNAQNDIFELKEVHDGFFQPNKRLFEWNSKHFELEIKINMSDRSDMELCRKSFKMNLDLFDASSNTKSN